MRLRDSRDSQDSETPETPGLPRLRDSRDSQDSRDSETPENLREHDVTLWRKTVNCWDMLRVLVSPLVLTLFIGSVTSYQSERCILCDFIFKKRRNSNVQASRFVLTIRLGRFEVTFPHISQMNHHYHICMEGHTKQLLGNARISSILIVAKESHESSTLSVYPCSQCIDMRRSTSCFILFYCEPQQEKSKK